MGHQKCVSQSKLHSCLILHQSLTTDGRCQRQKVNIYALNFVELSDPLQPHGKLFKRYAEIRLTVAKPLGRHPISIGHEARSF